MPLRFSASLYVAKISQHGYHMRQKNYTPILEHNLYSCKEDQTSYKQESNTWIKKSDGANTDTKKYAYQPSSQRFRESYISSHQHQVQNQ